MQWFLPLVTCLLVALNVSAQSSFEEEFESVEEQGEIFAEEQEDSSFEESEGEAKDQKASAGKSNGSESGSTEEAMFSEGDASTEEKSSDSQDAFSAEDFEKLDEEETFGDSEEELSFESFEKQPQKEDKEQKDELTFEAFDSQPKKKDQKKAVEEPETPQVEKPQVKKPEVQKPEIQKPAEKTAAAGEKESPTADEPVYDEPNRAYEKKLYNTYLNYHSSPMEAQEWASLIKKGEVETYQIQKGDTLWGISKTFFGDGDYWPKIWALNERITNPHLIRPGNAIRFKLGTEAEAPAFAVTEGAKDKEGVKMADEVPQQQEETVVGGVTIPPPLGQYPPVNKDLPPSLPEWSYEQQQKDQEYDDVGMSFGKRPILDVPNVLPLSAFIQQKLPKTMGRIREAQMGGRVASENQFVYVQVKKGRGKAGDKFMVLHKAGPLRRANNYIQQDELGMLVQVQGEVKLEEMVTSKVQDNNYDLFRARVTHAINPVEVGSKITQGEVQKMKLINEGPRNNVASQIIGGINDRSRRLFGEQAIVFLDRGSQAGLAKGQILPVRANRVLRRSDTIVAEDSRKLGFLRVVKTTPRFATAVVLNARAPIYAGDFTGQQSVGVSQQDMQQAEQTLAPQRSKTEQSESTAFSGEDVNWQDFEDTNSKNSGAQDDSSPAWAEDFSVE